MRDGPFICGGDSDDQICNIYAGTDFMVTAGLNAGDGITSAANSNVGDVYVFSKTAKEFELIVRNDSDHSVHAASRFGLDADGNRTGLATEIGTLGKGLELDSRLTFCGSDGSTIDVLMVQDKTAHNRNREMPASAEYFLPLLPLEPNIEYTLLAADENPGHFSFADYSCVCFGRGTMIRMSDGTEKQVQDLEIGDSALTKDNGAQKIRWIGGRTVRAFGHLAPIVFATGAMENHADLIVSQQHRMLLSDWRAEVMLGSQEVLVKAKDLVNGDTIYRREGGVVEYFHILFDNHEIIFADGMPAESLQINKTTLDGLACDARAEIIELFPELETNPQISAFASRMSLRSYEATALLKQVGFR